MLEQSRQGHRSTVQPRWPGQLQELFHDKIDPIQLAGHNTIELLHKATIVMLPTDQLGKSTDRSERFFYLVCHACRHLSQSGKPVSTVQLALQRLHGCKVFENGQD